MEQEIINRLIASYVDLELNDHTKTAEIKQLIEIDKGIEFDYKVQLLIKSLVTEKLKIKPAPERLRKKIIRKIKPGNFLKKLFQ